MSRKPVLLDRTIFCGGLAKAHRFDTSRSSHRGVREHGRASTARSDRRGEGRQALPPRLRAEDGRARPHRADGEPDARLLRRGAGADEPPTTSRPSAAAAARSRCCGGRAPTLLNPHFAVGTKDQDGSRIFYEPLAGWDAGRQPVPVLAAEIPSRENGGLAEDGKSVTWKLKQDVQVARRQAVHRRRLSSSTGNTPPTRRPPR